MVSNNKFTITNIEEIISEMTSHGVGVKKVLLNNDDTVSAITQIAYTTPL